MCKYVRILSAALLLLSALPSYALKIGDQAPGLQNIQWIKNGPVDIAQGRGRTVYVVEFWATWCPPCRESIPHLTALQEKYKQQGLVIAGISIDENIQIAKDFAMQNAEMKYNVGFDAEGRIAKIYMTEDSGIPTAFVIDKSGIIAWIGHPMELDNILESVIAGTFDAKKVSEQTELNKKILQQMMSGNYAEALKLNDEMLKLDPGGEQPVSMKAYLLFLAGKGETAINFIDEQIKAYPGKHILLGTKLNLLHQLKKYQALDKECDAPSVSFVDPMVLNTIATGMINPELGQHEDAMIIQLALKLAETAYLKCNFKDDEQKSLVLATLASCYFKLNKTVQAVEMQKLSIGLTKDKRKIENLEKQLNVYSNAAAGITSK